MCLRGEMIEVYSLNEIQARLAEELYINHPKYLCFQCKYPEWKKIPPHVLKNQKEWKKKFIMTKRAW